jgi:hypothetical protein
MNRQNVCIKKAVEIVKSLGYKCFYPKSNTTNIDNITYCYITNGENISYMQSNWYGDAVELCCLYKPNKECGSSCKIYNGENEEFAFEELTKDVIESTFKLPNWIKRKAEANKVKLWDWEDYCKNSLTIKLNFELIEM